MFTSFEDYAANQMLGQPDSPPRSSGKLYFSAEWQRTVFGMAMALSKAGHFEWEAFRQRLIESIAAWERGACTGQTTWDYYDRYAMALIAVLEECRVIEAGELDQLAAPAR